MYEDDARRWLGVDRPRVGDDKVVGTCRLRSRMTFGATATDKTVTPEVGDGMKSMVIASSVIHSSSTICIGGNDLAAGDAAQSQKRRSRYESTPRFEC